MRDIVCTLNKIQYINTIKKIKKHYKSDKNTLQTSRFLIDFKWFKSKFSS